MDRQREIKGFEEFNLENKDKNKDKGKIGNNKVNCYTAQFSGGMSLFSSLNEIIGDEGSTAK